MNYEIDANFEKVPLSFDATGVNEILRVIGDNMTQKNEPAKEICVFIKYLKDELTYFLSKTARHGVGLFLYYFSTKN